MAQGWKQGINPSRSGDSILSLGSDPVDPTGGDPTKEVQEPMEVADDSIKQEPSATVPGNSEQEPAPLVINPTIPAVAASEYPTPYDALRSAIADLHGRPYFTLFLSTNTFFPEPRIAHSSRVQTHHKKVQAPYTETPFDCHPSFPVNPSSLTLAETAKIGFLVKFGRPLLVLSLCCPVFLDNDVVIFRFWALHESYRGNETGYPLGIAIQKLTRAAGPGPTAVLAALDQRLHLAYDPRHRSTRIIEENQVSSYMRLIYVAPQHSYFHYSGYSSEPFLAEAAANALSSWRNSDRGVAIGMLAKVIGTFLSSQGDVGELVARFIFMSAYDRAVEKLFPSPPGSPFSPPHFSDGVDVESFLRSLISREHVENFLNSKPGNISSHPGSEDTHSQNSNITLREAFSSASIRFTHFIRTSDPIHISLTQAALCRGAAIMCHLTQEAVDFVVPVIMNRDNQMTKAEVTAIFVQCKLRKRRAPATLDIDADSIQFFESGQLPYIAVIMDLGGDTDEVKFREQAARQSPRNNHGTLDGVHPRYTVTIRGCSSRVYAAIDNGDEPRYQKLLGRDLYSELVRKSEANVDAVRRMVPLWAEGEASMGWVQDVEQREESMNWERDAEQ